jgi:hypothetical protein
LGSRKKRFFIFIDIYFFNSKTCGTQSISANNTTSALTDRTHLSVSPSIRDQCTLRGTSKNVVVFCDSNVKS